MAYWGAILVITTVPKVWTVFVVEYNAIMDTDEMDEFGDAFGMQI